jgi:hypothetical protein
MTIGCLCLTWLLTTGSRLAGQQEPVQMTLTGTLPPELAEASGVATSRVSEGIFWVHNDSGHRPWLYAIDETGTVHARFLVPGVRATDWEDIASGPCLRPQQGSSCLYIADTGDNNSRRPYISIFVVPEPDISNPDRQTAPAEEIRLRLIRGPTDIEAIAVTPGGQIFLFSKGREGRVFAFRIDNSDARIATESGGALDLRVHGQLNIAPTRSIGSLVTGAAFSQNGNRLVVRTYRTLYFYRMIDGMPELIEPSCQLGAAEPQGEAVDFIADHTVIVVSERLSNFPATIYVVRCG